jgi:hypothetical protein
MHQKAELQKIWFSIYKYNVFYSFTNKEGENYYNNRVIMKI